MSFVEDIQTLVTHYRRLSKEAALESSVSAKDYSREQPRTKAGSTALWLAEGGAQEELSRIERTAHNMALLTRARDLQREMVKRYGEGTDDLRKARRKAALEEEGRSPVEVALLYGYSNSHQVRELRLRKNRRPDDGVPVHSEEKPFTSRELPEVTG